MSDRVVTLTIEEQKAIKRLRRVINGLPETLNIFAWAGTMVILKGDDKDNFPCVVDDCFNHYCDGGDPTDDEVDQHAEVAYEEKTQ